MWYFQHNCNFFKCESLTIVTFIQFEKMFQDWKRADSKRNLSPPPIFWLIGELTKQRRSLKTEREIATNWGVSMTSTLWCTHVLIFESLFFTSMGSVTSYHGDEMRLTSLTSERKREKNKGRFICMTVVVESFLLIRLNIINNQITKSK